MRVASLSIIAALLVTVVACRGTDAPGPAALDTRNDACAHCRMSVSSAATAAQVVAPGEEPTFFDDLDCLANWLRSGQRLPAGARAFVADHRTKAWVPADTAVFTRVPGLQTPMGSGIIAHESEASRDQDPATQAGEPVAVAEILAGRWGGQR